MDGSWILAKTLEISKMGRVCNVSGCCEPPTKRVLVSERNLCTRKKRDLASIYFCTKHYNNELRPIINTLRGACSKGVKIEKRVREIGCITH